MTIVERHALYAMLLGMLALPVTAAAAEDAPARRDAAEVVKEGDVSQWLQHYQRERAEAWSRQQNPAQQQPLEQDKPAAPKPARDKPDR